MTTPNNAPAGAILSRAASLEPATFDVTASTVELVASTGATVRRRDWWTGEEFDEVLVVNSAAVDLTRFEAGSVPILNAHSQWEVRDVLGAALPGSARFESGALVLTAKLSARDDAAPVIRDVKDGILRNVSVGYRILAYEVDETTKPKTRTITRWELLEVSFVPVGADGLAGTRSLPTTHPTPDNTKEHRMSTPPATSPAPPTDPLATMRAAEADRIAHIQSRAASAQLGLPSDMITRAITEGWSLDAFNRAVIDHVAAKPSNQRNINPHFQEYDSYDDPTAIRSAMAQALAARMAPGLVKPEGRARDFMSLRALDMFAELEAARGVHLGRMSQQELAKRALGAHTTSDFPALIETATNAVLMARYEAAAPTYRQWAARRSFNDFRDHSFIKMGDFPSLRPLPESGELKFGTMSEGAEKVRAQEYAAGFAVTRQLLINDSLGGLGDFASMIAIRAASDESRLVYGLLSTNPVMSDGKPLFHAGHGNLAAGAAITIESIGVTVALLRKQKSLDGVPLNLAPRFLVVGPDGELAGRQLLAAIVANQAGNANPWSGSMSLVIDANVEGTAWYLFADPVLCPSVVYGYVGDSEGPTVISETDFSSQSVKVRASIDFGYGAIDHIGAVKNPGAPSS